MKTFKSFIEQDQLIEMANAPSTVTGCVCIIWIQTKGEASGSHNSPRIKFQDDKSTNLHKSQLVPISINDNPEILIKEYEPKLKNKEIEQIKNWIILNKDLLLDHWNGKITSYEVFSQCKKV